MHSFCNACITVSFNNYAFSIFQSGLTKAVQESRINIKDAQDMVLNFVKKYTKPKHCLLAGNSVHVDKVFLTRFMPTFMNHLHYRIIDVSTVKELCK